MIAVLKSAGVTLLSIVPSARGDVRWLFDDHPSGFEACCIAQMEMYQGGEEEAQVRRDDQVVLQTAMWRLGEREGIVEVLTTSGEITSDVHSAPTSQSSLFPSYWQYHWT